MTRHLLNLLTALSLLLCVAAAALWVRSHSVVDSLRHGYIARPGRRSVVYYAESRRGIGRIAVHELRYDGPPAEAIDGLLRDLHLRPGQPKWRTRTPRPFDPASHHLRAAFAYEDYAPGVPPGVALPLSERARSLTFPLWAVVGASAAWPAAAWLLADRRRRRATLHRCPACGRDPSATPDRCPECGTRTRAEPPRGA